VRHAIAEALEVDELEQLLRAGAPRRLRDAAEAHPHLDVLLHREPREERRLLEHQRQPAAADVDRPGRHVVEADHQVEQRALAAARRSEQAHELALRDVERHLVERLQRAVAVVVGLRDVADADRHRRFRRRAQRARDRRAGRRGRRVLGGVDHRAAPTAICGRPAVASIPLSSDRS
jgi:hypothetical protein